MNFFLRSIFGSTRNVLIFWSHLCLLRSFGLTLGRNGRGYTKKSKIRFPSNFGDICLCAQGSVQLFTKNAQKVQKCVGACPNDHFKGSGPPRTQTKVQSFGKTSSLFPNFSCTRNTFGPKLDGNFNADINGTKLQGKIQSFVFFSHSMRIGPKIQRILEKRAPMIRILAQCRGTHSSDKRAAVIRIVGVRAQFREFKYVSSEPRSG